ncbi:MAG: hypothetical protein JNM07_04760 [Phycisphaerae bacterium]|nr:hypothetical protein [Phycisphaerae bacterium]
MARCRVDSSIERLVVNGFAYPLGVYPIEPSTPKEGYTLSFEPSDGGDGRHDNEADSVGESPEFDPDDDAPGDTLDEADAERGQPSGVLEEWPDRYVFDIAITSTRLEALCRTLFSLLPGRVFPILDVLGNDAFREVDPYVAYDPVGIERFLDALRRFRGFFYEDGIVGFGAMSEEPFLYIFVDEHKMVTVRAESSMKERVEKVLAAFDLKESEAIAGADAAAHEHRSVIEAPGDRPDLLTPDEIVEELQDEWGLVLNINPDTNVDGEGREIGITAWRGVVRVARQLSDRQGEFRYIEVLATAGNWTEIERLAVDAATLLVRTAPGNEPKKRAKAGGTEGDVVATAQIGESRADSSRSKKHTETEIDLISADRLTAEELADALKETGRLPSFDRARVWLSRWME